MFVLGIDPGCKGSIAVIDTDNPYVPTFLDLPLRPEVRKTKKRKCIDVLELERMLTPFSETDAHVGIEDLWGFKKEEKQANQWNFSGDYHLLKATILLMKLRHTFVAPQVWQQGVGKVTGSDKDESIMKAIQLFPRAELKKPGSSIYSHDRADALLIAYWTLKTQI